MLFRHGLPRSADMMTSRPYACRAPSASSRWWPWPLPWPPSRSVIDSAGTAGDESARIADSVLEDRQVQASRAAPISAIPVRSPYPMARKGVTEPADHRLLAGLVRRSAYAVFGTKRPPVQIRPPRPQNGRSKGIQWPAVCITRSRVSDFGSPLGANTGNGRPLGPRLAPSRCLASLDPLTGIGFS